MTDDAIPAETAPAPLSESEAGELAELRGEMADSRGQDFAGHWSAHYYHNNAKQARALELLDREAAGGVATPDVAAEPTDRGNPVRPVGRAQADEEGSVAQDIAADLDKAFGDTAEEINTAVLGLPDDLHEAMRQEMSSPYYPPQGEASRENVEDFTKTSHGAICAEKWGSDTGRRLAAAIYRTARFEKALSDADFAAWEDFFHNRLQPAERAAVLSRLTA